MDEAEAKRRIEFWETKKEAYSRRNDNLGVKRADKAIARIKEASGRYNKRPKPVEEKIDKVVKEDKGGLV